MYVLPYTIYIKLNVFNFQQRCCLHIAVTTTQNVINLNNLNIK